MNKYTEQGKLSKEAARKLQKIGQDEKRKILEYIADSLVKNSAYIIEQNKIDIKAAVKGDRVKAIAKIIHKGATIHQWQVSILNSESELVSSVQVTNIIVRKK